MKAATKILPSITDYDCYICFRKHLQLERIQRLFMKAYHEEIPVLLWSQMIPIYKLNNNDEKNLINVFLTTCFSVIIAFQIYKDWDDFILGLTGN
jgi:hypothetical protein